MGSTANTCQFTMEGKQRATLVIMGRIDCFCLANSPKDAKIFFNTGLAGHSRGYFIVNFNPRYVASEFLGQKTEEVSEFLCEEQL